MQQHIFSPAERAELAFRGSSLFDRPSLGVQAGPSSQPDRTSDLRVASWQQVLGGDGPDRLEKRLRWSGIDIETLRAQLSGQPALDNGDPPHWVCTLEECLQAAADCQVAPAGSLLPPLAGPPVRYQEVWVPFLLVAWRKFLTAAGPAADRLSPSARGALLTGLRDALVSLSRQTLSLELSLHCHCEPRSPDPGRSAPGPVPSEEDYSSYLAELFAGGLIDLFLCYPVLARLAATLVELWIEAEVEWVRRLAADWEVLHALVQEPATADPIVGVQGGLSDPHNRRRSVHIIELASGTRVVYKPKDIQCEAAFSELLEWLNRRQPLLPLRTLRVLPRDGYGWVEFVPQQPCASLDQACCYYQRAGMLLGLLHALYGSDIHDQNLIAAGEHPVLVDTEMFQLPGVRSRGPGTGHECAAAFLRVLHGQLEDSVLNTGLLPVWEVGPNGQAYDCSGLSCSPPESPSDRTRGGHNVVYLGDQPLRPDAFVEDIIRGFRAMVGLLGKHRDDLLAPTGPLQAFAALPVRFVYRATRVYDRLLSLLCHPRYLQDGADRAIALDRLARPLLEDEALPADWPVFLAELKALERMDFPYFCSAAASTDLAAEGDAVPHFFETAGHERVRRRLESLGETECAHQELLIRAAFHAYTARPTGASAEERTALPAIARLSKSEMIDQALRIGEELRRRAIRVSSGGSAWMTLHFLPEARQFRLQPTNFSTYDGCAGIGIFFAALERMTQRGYGELALDVFQPIRVALSSADGALPLLSRLGIEDSINIAAVVNGMVRTAQLLQEESLLEDALRLALLVTPERIAAVEEIDVISGCGGIALSLLLLQGKMPAAALEQRLEQCGRKLLGHPFVVPHPSTAPTLHRSRPLTGFAHGAAGVAYVLLRLWQWSGAECYKEAALRAMEYEQSVFDPRAGNWPDFRHEAEDDSGVPSFGSSWCHGAPGIALARLGGLSILDQPPVRADIEAAVRTTQGFGLRNVDHLCCGNMGQIDALLEAACCLQRPELLEAAEQRAALVVRNAEREGGFQLFANLPRSVHNPSLFLGAAGIGYELLRLVDPPTIPSILLMG